MGTSNLLELNNKRILMIANMIPKCDCLADIGTDHAFLPIYLIESNIVEKSIASDVKKGPIAVATKNINKYNLAGKIETRLGSGLTTLNIGECNTIVIAGMGGLLICEILDKSPEIVRTTNLFILQPMNSQRELRTYLYNNSFEIIDENSIQDGRHVYLSISCRYKPNHYIKIDDNLIYYTGTIMCKRLDENARSYYLNLDTKTKKALQALENSPLAGLADKERYIEYKSLRERIKDILGG